MEALAHEVWKRNGRVDVLCNNAGVATLGRIADQTLADWEWVFGVNFWGVLHGIRAFLPKLQAAGRPAHIVNTASLAGLVDGPMLAPYFVSKHAVVSLSECLYLELQAESSPIGVSVLCPGFVRTSIMDSSRNRSGGPTRPSSSSARAPRSSISSCASASPPAWIPPRWPTRCSPRCATAASGCCRTTAASSACATVAARSYGDQNPELTPIAQQAAAEPRASHRTVSRRVKAIQVVGSGKDAVLVLGDAPDPRPAPGEVLIDVAATAVNRADLLQRRGFYPPPPGASTILGLECSGTIAELGAGVTGWRAGDRVCALLPGGGYAERATAHAGSLLAAPSSMSLIEAGGLPEVFLTCSLNLFQLGGVEARRLGAGARRRQRRRHRGDPAPEARRRAHHRHRRHRREVPRLPRPRRRSRVELQGARRPLRARGARSDRRPRRRRRARLDRRLLSRAAPRGARDRRAGWWSSA